MSSSDDRTLRAKGSPDTIRTGVGRAGWKYSDEVYNRRWLARIMKKVVIDANGCWRWQGICTPTGYGTTSYRGISNGVHRIMYQLKLGVSLATEQYCLHHCDVRNCLNPDHIWIGTAKDNNNDCAGKGRHYEGSRDHCERGHPLSGDNLRVGTQKGGKGIRRTCIACERLRMDTPAYKAKALERQRRARAQKRLAQSGDSHV